MARDPPAACRKHCHRRGGRRSWSGARLLGYRLAQGVGVTQHNQIYHGLEPGCASPACAHLHARHSDCVWHRIRPLGGASGNACRPGAVPERRGATRRSEIAITLRAGARRSDACSHCGHWRKPDGSWIPCHVGRLPGFFARSHLHRDTLADTQLRWPAEEGGLL